MNRGMDISWPCRALPSRLWQFSADLAAPPPEQAKAQAAQDGDRRGLGDVAHADVVADLVDLPVAADVLGIVVLKAARIEHELIGRGEAVDAGRLGDVPVVDQLVVPVLK